MTNLLAARWRTGRKVIRNIYAVVGDEPSDDDIYIGVMDSGYLSGLAVTDHNQMLDERGPTKMPTRD